MENEKDSGNYPIGASAQERGMSHVPDCYILPPPERPGKASESEIVPNIDMAALHGTARDKSMVVEGIGRACREMGFFQIVNHGIPQEVLDEALMVASDFFKLSNDQKEAFMSNDVNRPVRYGTSLKDGLDRVQFWRVFLKHYAHPLEDYVASWPSNPPNYRKCMGKFAEELVKLSNEVISAVTESLGLGPKYLDKKMEDQMQVMAINCYPPCPRPDLTLGLPPHTDYSCITILLQSSPGLEIKPNKDGSWITVPEVKGTLEIHVGDHLEVLSNGRYKSILHRATLNNHKTRISIASLHSLGIDVNMETAPELVDEERPKGYKESSFRDFLKFLSTNDLASGKSFIESLKI